DFSRGFFHMIMINSFFGGLIIGKISEGDARYGLKHAVVLMAAGYIACALFILPPAAVPVGPKISITVVSGDGQTGLPGLPLKDDIVFKLMDMSGNPVNSTVVQFKISPGGSVVPTSDTSDVQGNVRVRASLGTISGPYLVTASANGVSKTVTISTNAAQS